MTIAVCIVGYVLGTLTCAYIIGVCDMQELGPFAIFWPLWLAAFILFAPLYYVAHLGERHC